MGFMRRTNSTWGTDSTIRCWLTLAGYVVAGMGFAVSARGGTINPIGPAPAGNNPAAPAGIAWQWSHQAQGWGRARVFDGGPEQFDSIDASCECTAFMDFLAFDLTRPGSRGARAGASGRSDIDIDIAEGLTGLVIFFTVTYTPSLFHDGDRPGGEAEGEFHTLDQLILPVDYPLLHVNGRTSTRGTFSGSSRFLIRNVTQDITLLDTDGFVLTDFILDGRAGDVIRFTLDAEGAASGPLGAVALSGYSADYLAIVTVPEPGSFMLLLCGVGLCGRRKTVSGWE